jgi:threonine/homoserine/homoserine lactone efflux protein
MAFAPTNSKLERIHMIPLEQLTLFILASLVILVIPGPAVLYIVTRSISQGRAAGLASVAGVNLAAFTYTVAAAFGLTAILMTSVVAFNTVKYAGAAYLVYLGISSHTQLG